MERDVNGHDDQDGGIGAAVAGLEERLGPGIEQVRTTLEVWNRQALRVMRERPGTCLLCAVGVGFLVGRLASRR